MLRKLGPEIWISDGASVDVIGFKYPTKMAIIRLTNGSLLIWSPITFSDELHSQINTLGVVRHIIAPNSLHHLSISGWQKAYPNAKVYAPPKLRDKRKDITFDYDLGNTPDSCWIEEIDQVIMEGNLITSEVVFFHKASGTILFADLLQQFPKDWFSGWRKITASLDLMLEHEPTVPRKFRLAFFNRNAARLSLISIKAWPVKIVLMAHGEPVTENATAFIRKAFSWLEK